MTKSETVRARVETTVKNEVNEVLGRMGLTVSDAIRMFLIRVAADKALPFDVNRTPAPATATPSHATLPSAFPNGLGTATPFTARQLDPEDHAEGHTHGA